MNQTQKEPIDVAAVLRKVIADNWGQPKGVTVPALDEAREALAFLESQPAPHEDTALLDWLENASLGKALRLDAHGDSRDQAKKQMLVRRGHHQAIVKFVGLGIAVGVLALHVWSPTGLATLPRAVGYGLSLLFCLASLAMLACIRFPRFLEPGTAMTGLGIASLFTICVW